MRPLKLGIAAVLFAAAAFGGCGESAPNSSTPDKKAEPTGQKPTTTAEVTVQESGPTSDKRTPESGMNSETTGASQTSKPQTAVDVTRGGIHKDWKNVPLEDAVQKGLRWLVSVQGKDGGWGQDGGLPETPQKGKPVESQGNDVANTAMACLALMRAGNTPSEGPNREALTRGIEFILAHVEASPADGLSVTRRKETQIQRKLGPNIDTFLANLVLAESDGLVKDAGLSQRVHGALEKCVAKIQKHQGKDGAWNEGGGWAPVIGSSLASRGLYAAQRTGAAVNEENLQRSRENAMKSVDADRAEFKADAASAGVRLYAAGAALEEASRAPPASAPQAALAGRAAAKSLSDTSFVRGFGSMGGEEFISYMNISDSLIRAGGEPWKKWNGQIKEHLLKVQNQDGTWAGHHCITGRVACTSGAVLTLLAERTAAKP